MDSIVPNKSVEMVSRTYRVNPVRKLGSIVIRIVTNSLIFVTFPSFPSWLSLAYFSIMIVIRIRVE